MYMTASDLDTKSNPCQTLTADLHKVGYRNQLSIDFSQVAIDAMKEKYQSLETNWKVMDVRRMDLENATFDIAIDKGTLDAMLHGSLWDPEDDVKANSKAYVDEVRERYSSSG